ncbi:MAG TPA: ABC transporter permease [Candidatus Hydrogenedentes bacterium]|nr:ABC transporter permease [Candidatus Hydrogenedentota bacterium]
MSSGRRSYIFLLDYLGLTVVLLLLIAGFSVFTENFFTLTNFRTIVNQTPDAVVIAVGMTFVLIIAGIDLSVGSVLGLSEAVLAVCLHRFGLPMPVGIAACLGTGLLCGVLNGATTITWRLPSFIVTLGMLEIARGGAYLVTNSRSIYLGTQLGGFVSLRIGGVSMMFVIAVLVVVAGQIVLSLTAFGRHLFAIGSNEEAARLSGIPTQQLKAAVFALSGFLAGLAALISAARLEGVNPEDGIGYELQAIAAVVIGGTSLFGGRGSVVRSFLGVMIIAVLAGGLAQANAQEHTKRLVTGMVIVAAVIIDYYRNRLRASSVSG